MSRAVEHAQAIADQWWTIIHHVELDGLKLVRGAGREQRRYACLPITENIDAETSGRMQSAVTACCLCDTNKDQRRVKGNGGKRVGGQAARPTVAIEGGDDRDAGQERAKHTAECLRACC